MDIFLTLFFALSALGHTAEYVVRGKMVHLFLFSISAFLTLWFGSLVLV